MAEFKATYVPGEGLAYLVKIADAYRLRSLWAICQKVSIDDSVAEL
jgi:hypothetical protein